jgi:hypothetical protein
LPLRPDLRNLRDENGDYVYRGPAWKARRERLLERCGNKCERCRKPNHETVETITGLKWPDGRPGMLWRHTTGWFNAMGVLDPARLREKLRKPHTIRVVLTMAHLTHDPLENDDADLAMLCQWCHLNYDRLHHKDTRSERKDAARPLLAGVA